MSRHVSNDLKARARKLARGEQIPYSAALARLRSTRPTKTTAASGHLVHRYLYIDFPEPELGGTERCEDCSGSGLSGDVFAMESDNGMPPLIVEVVCSTCLGCGRTAHDEENGCGVLHAGEDADEFFDDQDDEDEQERCFSCRGPGFHYTQGITEDDHSNELEVWTRTPCGCATSRARVIEGAPIAVSP